MNTGRCLEGWALQRSGPKLKCRMGAKFRYLARDQPLTFFKKKTKTKTQTLSE